MTIARSWNHAAYASIYVVEKLGDKKVEKLASFRGHRLRQVQIKGKNWSGERAWWLKVSVSVTLKWRGVRRSRLVKRRNDSGDKRKKKKEQETEGERVRERE